MWWLVLGFSVVAGLRIRCLGIGPSRSPRERFSCLASPLCERWSGKELLNGTAEEVDPQEICNTRFTMDMASALSKMIRDDFLVHYEVSHDRITTECSSPLGTINQDSGDPLVYSHKTWLLHTAGSGETFDLAQDNTSLVQHVSVFPSVAVPIKAGAELRFTWAALRVRGALSDEPSVMASEKPWLNRHIAFMFVLTAITGSAVKFIISKPAPAADPEDPNTECNWNLIGKDVFRPPTLLVAYATILAIGAQLLTTCVSVALVVLAASADDLKWSLVSLIFLLSQFVNGFVGQYIFRTFNGSDWKVLSLWQLLLIPVLFTAIVLQMEIILPAWVASPTHTSPLKSLAKFALLNIPVHFLGCFIGKAYGSQYQTPIKPNLLAKPLPPHANRKRLIIVCAISVIQAAAILGPLVCWLQWFWRKGDDGSVLHTLCAAVILYFAIVSLTSVVGVYQLFESEDYRWQWSAMAAGVGPMLAGGVTSYFAYHRLFDPVTFVGSTLFIGVSLLETLTLGVASAATSALSAGWFTHRMYKLASKGD